MAWRPPKGSTKVGTIQTPAGRKNVWRPPPPAPPVASSGGGGGGGRGMIQFRVGGVKTMIMAIRNVAVSEMEAANIASIAAGAQLFDAIRSVAMRSDHTLQQLAALDHPYARRHGTIKTRGLGHPRSPYLTNQANQVHKHTGKLVGSLRLRTSRGTVYSPGTYDPPRASVGFDAEMPDYVVYVVYGTKVMHGRNFIADAANSPGTARAIMKIVVRVFGKWFRSQGSLRFEQGQATTFGNGSFTGPGRLIAGF